MPTVVPQHEDLKNEENIQNYQVLETLEQDYKSGGHLMNKYESSKFEAKEKPNQECEIDKKPDDAIATYEQETVASERYDSSLVLRKVSEPQYGNDEAYSEDNYCNETAGIEPNSKNHVSNDEVEPEFETAETNSKDHIFDDELEPEYETDEVLEPVYETNEAPKQECRLDDTTEIVNKFKGRLKKDFKSNGVSHQDNAVN